MTSSSFLYWLSAQSNFPDLATRLRWTTQPCVEVKMYQFFDAKMSESKIQIPKISLSTMKMRILFLKIRLSFPKHSICCYAIFVVCMLIIVKLLKSKEKNRIHQKKRYLWLYYYCFGFLVMLIGGYYSSLFLISASVKKDLWFTLFLILADYGEDDLLILRFEHAEKLVYALLASAPSLIHLIFSSTTRLTSTFRCSVVATSNTLTLTRISVSSIWA